jgi:TIR domain
MAKLARQADDRIKVFISYSRRDLPFAQRVVAALEVRGLAPKLDTRDLPDLENWRRELLSFIREADAVVFIVSPNSVESRECAWEVAQVAELNKRLAPIVLERVPDDRIPEAIARINYLFFDQPHDFEKQADALARALQTDLGWVKNHTRLGELARRWDEHGRAASQTLRDTDLEEAERWIAARPRGAPEPTTLHRTYVEESRRGATRRLRYAVAGSLAVGIVAIALAGFAFVQRQAAETSRANATRVLATSDLQRGTTLLQSDETVSEGMALLARAVRRGEDSRALTRLWTLLQQRDFWFPAADPPAGTQPGTRQPPPIPESIKARFGKLRMNGGAVVETSFMSLSGDGKRVFTVVGGGPGSDVRFRVWLANGTPITPWLEPAYSGDFYLYAAKGYLSFDGKYLALEVQGWRETAYLQLFDLSGKETKRIGRDIVASGAEPHFQNVEFSQVDWISSKREQLSGELLLVASPKGDAVVFQVDTTVNEITRNRHAVPIVFAALDAKQEWLMSASGDGIVHVSSLDNGKSVGNQLALDSTPVSVARSGDRALAVALESGGRLGFLLHPRVEISPPADLKLREKVACTSWDEATQPDKPKPKPLMTPLGEVSRIGMRHVGMAKPGRSPVTSPVFAADVMLACLGAAQDRIAITTSDFVTEVWSLDFGKRFGVPIVERRLFGAGSTPDSTVETDPSPDGNGVTVTSHLWIPPGSALHWFSYWDLTTGLPLTDRLDLGGESARTDAGGRYVAFLESDDQQAAPIRVLQISPAAAVGAWLPDYVEAIGGLAVDDNGAFRPVPDRFEKLARFSGNMTALRAGSSAGK